MVFQFLPRDIINLILEYNGKIKYRKGNYYDQLNLQDEKYNLVSNTINSKSDILQKLIVRHTGAFLIDVPLNQNKYGFMYWHDFNRYMIAFYKNIDSSTKYNFVDVYYKFLQIYNNDLPISTYDYK
jgi:hypothetical protein